jgi:threonine synthase
MMDQLDWQVPDRVVVPGGNLGNLSAIGKGFKEMFDLGFIDRMPRLTVVQAKGADPFVRMLQSNADHLAAVTAHTLATAIKIGNPVSWKKALRALTWTNGDFAEVGEEEIADAKAMIGRDGIGCEPASAATLAGIKQMVASGQIDKDERVVAVLTGNLLKDPTYTIEYHSGNLVEDGTGNRIPSHFANPPRTVHADKDQIIALLNL